MKRLISVLVLASACVGKPYSVVVAPPAATLLPASHELQSYTSNSGLSMQLDRTTAYCGQVKQAIATEADARQRALTLRKAFLVSLGSAAGVGASIYNGIATSPDTRVTGILSGIAGGMILTAIPALGTDDRLTALNEKLAAIRAQEGSVLAAWNALEAQLLAIALLKAEPTPSPTQLEKDYRDAAPLEQALRLGLAALANSCQ